MIGAALSGEQPRSVLFAATGTLRSAVRTFGPSYCGVVR